MKLAQLQSGASLHEALAYYDSLAPVAVEEMLGAWKGSGLPTGNPLDGLLEATGWHGKRFDGPDRAHPLVFQGARGLFEVNPRMVPLGSALRFSALVRRPAVARASRRLLPLLRTSKPAARLRSTEYRGVLTATMCYDALPIHDVFRKVDGDTVVGAMDMRRMTTPFLFVLRRERTCKLAPLRRAS